MFTYTVTYKDVDNHSPNSFKYVNIDGSNYTMSGSGTDYVGGVDYTYSTTLPLGTHNYYFYFEDLCGCGVRLPTSGTYSDPVVTFDTLKIHCFQVTGPSLANLLELYATTRFDEMVITWNNKPPYMALLDTNPKVDTGWYYFYSESLTNYVNNCILADSPVCFVIKRKIQVGNNNIWYYDSKETGGTPTLLPAVLSTGTQTATPPTHDAKVNEASKDQNYGTTSLWTCNYASPDSQESYIRFDSLSASAKIEEKPKKENCEWLKISPNPGRNEIYISYALTGEDRKDAVLKIYNVTGKLVKAVDIKESDRIKWDARDNNGKRLASGIYFFTLTIGDRKLTAKSLILQ